MSGLAPLQNALRARLGLCVALSAIVLGGCDSSPAEKERFEAVVRGSGVEHRLSGAASLVRVPGENALRVTLQSDGMPTRTIEIALEEPATGRVEIGPRRRLAYEQDGSAPFVGVAGSIRLTHATPERLEGTFSAELATADGEPTVFTASGSFDAVDASRDRP